MSNLQGEQYSGYQPAADPVLGKNCALKYSFDSPNTIAKQHQFQPAGGFQQAGGIQQGLSGGVPPPPIAPKARTLGLGNRRKFNLKTRDWSGQPWSNQQGVYGPPTSGFNSFSRAGQTSYPFSADQPVQQHSSGLTGYQPSSTIPLSHNYQLPHSQLSQSSTPATFDAPLSKNISGQQWNNQQIGGQQWGNQQQQWGQNQQLNAPLAKNLSTQQGLAGIPAIPRTGYSDWNNQSWGQWRRNHRGNYRRVNHRTKDWGFRGENGWSGYNNQNILSESFLRNRPNWGQQGLQQGGFQQGNGIPVAPRLPLMKRHSTFQRGPYRMRPLRTRSWGNRSENGWAGHNRGLFNVADWELPFNKNRSLAWGDSQRGLNDASLLSQNSQFLPVQQQQHIAPIAAPIAAAPIAAAPIAAVPLMDTTAGTGLKNPSIFKRSGLTKSQKKQRKQQAIQNKLVTQLNPPIGDPAVNHYRRGVHATVPLAGPNTGLAAPTGSKAARRRGRRNNLGRRHARTAGPALPVPATQPPFVAPVVAQPIAQYGVAPIAQQVFHPATYRTVYSNPNIPQNYTAQPTTAFQPAPIISQSQPLYSGIQQQSRPLSSNFGTVHQPSNAALYSAREPVVANILEKPVAPTYVRPTGAAAF